MSSLLLVRSYSRIVNRYRTDTWASDISLGPVDKARNVSVTSSKAFHVSHPVFFPLVLKDEIVSQPVKAWKTGRALDLSGPITEAISWAAIAKVLTSSEGDP